MKTNSTPLKSDIYDLTWYWTPTSQGLIWNPSIDIDKIIESVQFQSTQYELRNLRLELVFQESDTRSIRKYHKDQESITLS